MHLIKNPIILFVIILFDNNLKISMNNSNQYGFYKCYQHFKEIIFLYKKLLHTKFDYNNIFFVL